MKKLPFFILSLIGFAYCETCQITSPLPLPVSGSFTSTSGPIPGSVTVTPGTGTFPVSGSFSGGPLSVVGVAGSTTSVGYQTGLSSVPVNILNATLTVNPHAIIGTVAVTPSSGTYPVQTIGTVAVTPSSGTYPISVATPYQVFTSSFGANSSTMAVSVLGTVPVSGTFFQAIQPVSGVGTFAVTPSSGTYPTSAVGQFTVTPGSGVFNTSQSGTYTVTPGTGITSVAGTGTFAVVPASGTFTVGTHAVTGNGTFAVVPASGTFSVQTIGTVAVTPSSGIYLTQQQGTVSVTPTTGTYTVQTIATVAVTPSSGTYPVSAVGQFTVTPGSGSFLVTLPSTATFGSATPGIGNANGVFVSSTTIPTGTADGNLKIQAGTNIGQILATGIPFGIIQSSFNTTISSVTIITAVNGETVLISSGGANTYSYLCGCLFTSTMTATGGNIFIESPSNTRANRYVFGVSTGSVNTILWPGCMNPFYRSAVNSSTYIYQTFDAAHSMPVNFECQYYNGP